MNFERVRIVNLCSEEDSKEVNSATQYRIIDSASESEEYYLVKYQRFTKIGKITVFKILGTSQFIEVSKFDHRYNMKIKSQPSILFYEDSNQYFLVEYYVHSENYPNTHFYRFSENFDSLEYCSTHSWVPNYTQKLYKEDGKTYIFEYCLKSIYRENQITNFFSFKKNGMGINDALKRYTSKTRKDVIETLGNHQIISFNAKLGQIDITCITGMNITEIVVVSIRVDYDVVDILTFRNGRHFITVDKDGRYRFYEVLETEKLGKRVEEKVLKEKKAFLSSQKQTLSSRKDMELNIFEFKKSQQKADFGTIRFSFSCDNGNELVLVTEGTVRKNIEFRGRGENYCDVIIRCVL